MLQALLTHYYRKKIVCIAKADSGASTHFWTAKDKDKLNNVHFDPGPTVTLPNKVSINDNESGYILLPDIISKSAKKAQIISD